MKKKIISLVLAITLLSSGFVNIGYAQTEEMGLYTVQEQQWKISGISFDKPSPQQLSENVTISADVENSQEDLRYKFVWMKNNWKEWGVLQDFSEKNSVKWQPKSTGEYYLYVDVKDESGKTESVSKPYRVIKNIWNYQGITPFEPAIKVGQSVTVAPELSGNIQGLQYKFVWMRDNWKEWKVLRDFSEQQEIVFTPEQLGKCTVYVDVKDQESNVISKSITYDVKSHIWKYDGVNTSLPSPQERNAEPITVSAVTSGENEGLQYKFVWMKDNWKSWGVLREFSIHNSVQWNPESIGKYTIYVDVKDLDGNVITKALPYEIVKAQWKYERIETSPAEEQKRQQNVEIKAITSGNTKGLQYKFVWMKDNWKEWGVIREESEKNTAIWKTPNKSGQYKLYIDIRDLEGKVQTKELDYFVVSQIWNPEEITVNNDINEQVYTKIPIKVTASGDIRNLQYKFVWKKGTEAEDWNSGWGEIRGFGLSNETSDWYPKEAGVYTIYVNIKDVDGRVKTLTKEYEVLEAPWKLDGITLDGSPDRFVGDNVKVTAVTSGDTEGLQYKFVCRRGNDWSDWEVVREFSANNSIEIPLSKATDYNIYVDIKDQRGVTFEPVVRTVYSHKYLSAATDKKIMGIGQSVKLYPDITGKSGEMQYKYVWMKDNWQQWGVIREFSLSSSVNWTPPTVGNYTIYIDVKANGVVQSKSVGIQVTNLKNGWYYEDGYKFYYKDGVKQLDLDGILPKQSSYYIGVNRTACTVTVYAKDGNNGYIIPVKSFACSVGKKGTETPTGTFYTPERYRWHVLMGPSYGQYCTRINGGVLFHSVAGRNMTSYNLNAKDYNMLGQPASHGCVRLCVRDAKWIYDNCPLKTKVTIYDSSYPGPLGKPATIKIPAGQTWDPTDPNI